MSAWSLTTLTMSPRIVNDYADTMSASSKTSRTGVIVVDDYLDMTLTVQTLMRKTLKASLRFQGTVRQKKVFTVGAFKHPTTIP